MKIALNGKIIYVVDMTPAIIIYHIPVLGKAIPELKWSKSFKNRRT